MLRVLRCLALAILALGAAACTGDGGARFGAVLPLSGTAQIYGESIRRGIDLAVEEAQREPDRKVKISMTVLDSGSDPAKAKALLEQLYEEHALAVIGGVTSAEALEMVSVAEKYDRPLISPSASNPKLTGISSSFFRVFPSDVLEGSKMALFAWDTLEVKTAMMISESGPYASGVVEIFAKEFERQGGRITDSIAIPAGVELGGVVDRVLSVNPEAVYVAAFAPTTADVVKQLRRRGYPGKILATSAFATPGALTAAGDAANGVLFTQTSFDIDDADARVRSFVAAYQAKYGVAPDLYAAHGYDAAKVLFAALDKARALTADEVWKGLRALRDYPGVTGSLQFDERGDVQKFPRIYAILEGRPENYEARLDQRRAEIKRRLEELRRQRENLNPGR